MQRSIPDILHSSSLRKQTARRCHANSSLKTLTRVPQGFAGNANDGLASRAGCLGFLWIFINLQQRRAPGIRAVSTRQRVQKLLVMLYDFVRITRRFESGQRKILPMRPSPSRQEVSLLLHQVSHSPTLSWGILDI